MYFVFVLFLFLLALFPRRKDPENKKQRFRLACPYAAIGTSVSPGRDTREDDTVRGVSFSPWSCGVRPAALRRTTRL